MRRIWTAEEIEKIYAELVSNHRAVLAKHIYGELKFKTIDLEASTAIINVIVAMHPGWTSFDYIEAKSSLRTYILQRLGVKLEGEKIWRDDVDSRTFM